MGAASSKPLPTVSVTRETAREDDEKLVSRLAGLTMAPPARAPAAAPLSSQGSISFANLDAWEATAAADPTLQLARTILAHSNLRTALTRREAAIADCQVFNVDIDFKTGPITNQRSSGRCWLFATTNVIRYNVMKKLKLKEFELSQSYLYFWDKLNKCNYYLELAIENADLPLDDRLVYHLSDDIASDGGQWDMVVNILETYGMVPQPIYPESTHSSLSSPLNTLVKTKLREHALILRDLSASLRFNPSISPETALATVRAKKESLMQEIYTIMTATLGVPPKADAPFTWDYYDADGKAHAWTGTPREFYRAFADKAHAPADCFSLINDPRNAYGRLYTVDKLGNVWGGRPVLYVNTEIQDLKDAVVRMVKAGVPVFFGCDVGQSSDSAMGIMDTALFAYEDAFGIKLGLTKAQRLQVHESSMTHAMVISGVHLDAEGKPVRYRVENSWGDAPGEKGWFMMTDAWFEQFVYQVVVHKSFAPKRLVDIYEGKRPVVLPPWDPMGSLA